jgi:hypothetical protein
MKFPFHVNRRYIMDNKRIKNVAEQAELAFWEVVAKSYPEIKTSNMSPLDVMNFSAYCENIIGTWVKENQE